MFLVKNVYPKTSLTDKKVYFTDGKFTFCCLKESEFDQEYFNRFNKFDICFSLSKADDDIMLNLKDIKPSYTF